jgi:hypothetical protein
MPPLHEKERAKLARASLQAFEAEVEGYARQLSSGRWSSERWHQGMRQRIAQLYLEQGVLGNGTGIITPSQALNINARLLRQNRFLKRFLAQVNQGLVQGKPFSARYTAWRSKLYGGDGVGVFWRTAEDALRRELEGKTGWVIRYVPLDDGGTCSPCREAAGHYLLGSGPMPGDVCLGRQRCRCRRVRQYSPSIWKRLIGEGVPATAAA